MNNADEIRKQIQEAKDGIIDAVCCMKDHNDLQYLVSTGMLERLVNDLHTLERQLIEMERVMKMNNADDVRRQIQAAKDALCSEIMIRSDRGAFAPLINKLVGDIRSLEVKLAESERVILTPGPSYDSLQHGQEYFVRFKRGEEMIASEKTSTSTDGTVRSRAISVSDLDQIFIPVE